LKNHRLIFILTISAVFFFTARPAFSGGTGEINPEDDLKPSESIRLARQYIEDQQLNLALQVLKDMVEEYPDRLDQAMPYLREIEQLRSEYVDLAYETLDYLEQEDAEAARDSIAEMKARDKNPNKSTTAFINRAQRNVELVVSRARFREIMDSALIELDQENYVAAIELYLSGYDLHRFEFDENPYGDVVKNLVYTALEDMNQAVDRYVNQINRYDQLYQQALSLNPLDLASFRQAVEEIHNLRRRIQKAALTFGEQNEIIRINSEDNSTDFFLGYAELFTGGRQLVDHREGLLGAVERFHDPRLATLVAALEDRSDTSYQQGLTLYSEGQYQEAIAQMDQTLNHIGVTQEWTSLWSSRLLVQENLAPFERDKPLASQYIPQQFTHLRQEELARQLIGLSRVMTEANENILTPQDSLEVILAKEQVLDRALDTLELQETSVENLIESEQRRNEGITFTSFNNQDLYGPVLEQTELDRQEINRWEIALADREMEILEDPLQGSWAQRQDRLAQSKGFLEGIEQTFGEEENQQTLVSYYPDNARDILAAEEEEINLLQSQIEEFLDRLQDKKDYIQNSPELQQREIRMREILTTLEEVDNQRRSFLAVAQERVFEAEKLKNEGYFRIQQTEAAINAQNFDFAEQQVAFARDKFLDSLSIQEDLEFRAEVDGIISSLSQRIIDERFRIVIVQVRDFINSGRRFYLQSSFERAEEILVRAQKLWESVSTEDNDEINRWLSLSRNALSVQTGRDIPVTDPLYPEIRQLLNLAWKDFETAKDFIAKGNNRDAIVRLESAEEKITKVRLPFPLNQEVSILSLRILQIKDQDAFGELFRERFNQARNKINSDPQEAYIDLTDLQAINPRYPGLTNAIYRVEIILGIRIPEPDPRDIREARELYQQALAIVQGNVRAQYPIALSQLKEANQLDPNNQEVLRLLDRIRIDAGERTTLTLTSVAQQQYRDAVEKFTQGRILEAKLIVDNLLKDSKNTGYSPLLELKERIESQL